MTTIRKIVTSKIDGNNANSNDINEIRPFGETAFYLDTNGPTNKLTLMMFDGVRTNQRSKVLSPGVLFGSNADSADGGGLDTIKLIPDARLHYNFGDYGNDQYLVIDPTAPNHIHIRAGGTIDSSNAELYLGGELTHVKVSDGADNVVIRTSTLGEGITERNWIFGSDGSLSLPNGLTVLGGAPLLVAETGNDLGIETSRLASVSAECAPRGSGDNFVADITDNDDITVVREGWNVVVDGTLYVVTTIMTGIGEFDIFATGANFVPGTTYTFINPTPVTSNWVFGLDGALTTPGSGTISHQNNDLKVEVTGTDVIVLRTAGGDLLLNADASLTFSDGVSTISAVDPAQSGGVGGLSVNGKDRTYIGISGNEYGYNWDFRAFGLNDETTAKPTIKFPGNGWLQEDLSNLGIGGFDVPTQLGSQGAFTLTVKDNSTFPGPAPTYNWTFGTDGKLALPPAGKISNGVDTIQVGSSLVIATASGGGLTGWNSQSLSVDYNADILSTYAVGDTITWQDGTTATITGFDNYGPAYIDIFWDTPKSGTLFPITLKTDNYAAAVIAPKWTFGTDGNLTFPDATVQTTAYTGSGAITFTGNEIQGNTFGGTGSLITKTVDANGDSYSTGGGSIGFLNFGADGNIQNVKAGWTVTFASGETRTVSLDAWQPLGTYWNISFDSAYNWTAGDIMPVTFSSPDYVAGTDPLVTLAAGTKSWTFDDAGTLTLPAGMTIETAYGGGPTLVVDGKTHTVELRSDNTILIGYNDSSGNVYIGNPEGTGQVDIVGPKFRVFADVPTASTGAVGDQAGQVAFNGSYIYYCTADYTDGLSNIWKRVAWSTDTW